MLSLTDLITEYQDVTNDISTTNKSRAIRRFNQIQNQICSGKDFWWLRRELTTTTVANQAGYDIPLRFRRLTSIKITVGDKDYTPIEMVNPRDWDKMVGQDGANFTSDYPDYYHIRDGKLYLFPRPATSGYTITILGLLKPVQMKLEDYTTGTIAVTNGSTTVTGTGTSWSSSNARAGAYIFIDDVPYEIAAVGSTTSITLVKKYQGTTASGLSYKVGDVTLVYEDFQDIVWIRAAKTYLGIKKANQKIYQTLTLEESRLLTDLENSTESESTDHVIQKYRVGNWGYQVTPTSAGDNILTESADYILQES